MSIMERYGTVLRCYDNGGKTCDRYTIIPPRWDQEHRYADGCDYGLFTAFGSSSDPFHPQGFGMIVTARPGPHLGKRVRWDDLPVPVQKAARNAFPEYVKDNDHA